MKLIFCSCIDSEPKIKRDDVGVTAVCKKFNKRIENKYVFPKFNIK